MISQFMTSPPMLGIISLSINLYRVEGKSEKVQSSPIIIFEGILSLYDERIRELMDIKIFVFTDDDIRLARRCNEFLLLNGYSA